MKVALIGAGQIARQHLAALEKVPIAEVAGICDLFPSVAECAAERHRISAWYTDHRKMLAEVKPDVVHVTTPAASHLRLATDALDAGAHVIVEKPATATLAELEQLLRHAQERGRTVVEDYNYLFNQGTREILRRMEEGALGSVVHVEVSICLDILGPNGFADPNVSHPALGLRGGAIADFLPHLASLAHLFVGPHRSVRTVWNKRNSSVLPSDEFRAVVDAERGTAALSFSASSQPDSFWLRVHGTRMLASTNLFETRLVFDGLRPGPKPLRPFINGLLEARDVGRAAVTTLLRKFTGGPGGYEGLFELVARVYRSLSLGIELPITAAQIRAVNQLADALKPPEAVKAPPLRLAGGRDGGHS